MFNFKNSAKNASFKNPKCDNSHATNKKQLITHVIKDITTSLFQCSASVRPAISKMGGADY